MSDQFYDKVGLDTEIRAALTPVVKTARTFLLLVETGAMPNELMMFSEALSILSTELHDLLVLRFGPAAPGFDKETDRIRIEDHISPEDAATLDTVMRHIAKRNETR